MTEDEIVGWHHQLDGHEFEQSLGDSEGQGTCLEGVTAMGSSLPGWKSRSGTLNSSPSSAA